MSEEKKPGEVRIWLDGCFDMFHWGHANVLRQVSLVFDDGSFLGSSHYWRL